MLQRLHSACRLSVESLAGVWGARGDLTSHSSTLAVGLLSLCVCVCVCMCVRVCVCVCSTTGVGRGVVQPGVQPLGSEHVERGLSRESVSTHTQTRTHTHTHAHTHTHTCTHRHTCTHTHAHTRTLSPSPCDRLS